MSSIIMKFFYFFISDKERLFSFIHLPRIMDNNSDCHYFETQARFKERILPEILEPQNNRN